MVIRAGATMRVRRDYKIMCSLSGSSECGQWSYCVYPDCIGHYYQREPEPSESYDSLGRET